MSSKFPPQFTRLAEQMAGLAELGGLKERLTRVLAAHQMARRPRRVPGSTHPETWCVMCDQRWECDTFVLAAAQVSLLELFDGTRFGPDWPGPVEERHWG